MKRLILSDADHRKLRLSPWSERPYPFQQQETRVFRARWESALAHIRDKSLLFPLNTVRRYNQSFHQHRENCTTDQADVGLHNY